jgi:DNA polymerase-3 subunit gamma/tau
MSYTVLARKYRSRSFDDVVGQEPIATTLKNAVASGRIHHGYLFTGTRGVGKTSMARILAKALNCLASDAPTTSPCGECELCVSVAEGRDIDVIEIDAASNTGVDNIRELRSNTIYRPARARYKVYIIDEVHMLSQGAFNALLKTLEEPPEHVKFIFATTEPQRVPATIQSRCQRFDFRSISVDKIAAHLQQILKTEKIKADEAAVRRVARLANGSMRDALSLLDQLLSLGADRLRLELIDEILPTPHDELLAELVDRLAASDPAGAMVCLDRCLSGGHSLEQLCSSLIDYLRQLMVIRVCGAQTELVDLPGPVRDRLAAQAGQFDAASFTYMITVVEELRRSVRFSGSGRALTEAAMVRLASMERFSEIEAILGSLGVEAGRDSKTGGAARVAHTGPGGGQSGRQAAQVTQGNRGPTQANRRPLSPGQDQRGGRRPVQDARVNFAAPINREERRAALAEPLVRKTIELFDGELTNIEKEAIRGPVVPPDEPKA